MSITLERGRQRAHFARLLVDEAWKADHRDAQSAHTAEELTHECLQLYDVVDRAWKNSRDQLFAGRIRDIERFYASMTALVDSALSVSRHAHALAFAAVNNGFAIAEYETFTKRIDDLVRLKAEVDRHAPKVDSELAATAYAEYSRGDFQTAEDLLRHA